ncbi:hypothetical protein DCC79_07590 [bacterium]|nr:MAG: hypothetical protein DCC79_07590 [bacterium]
MTAGRDGPWRAALVHGGAVATVVVALAYHWFAVADRHAVFLYGHRDRIGEPAATPFDPVTRSRYWMTGFVAAGVVCVAYNGLAALAGAAARRRGRPVDVPAAWRTWLAAAPCVAVGIPAIAMTQNHPTLPPGLALSVAGVALAGLALALAPARRAARDPVALAWAGLDGIGVAVPALTWRALELPGLGIHDTPPPPLIAGAGLAAGAAWLWILTVAPGRRPWPGTAPLFAAGLTWICLAAPLAHHLVFTPPGFRYITSAANVFGHHAATASTAFAIMAGMAVGTCRWRAARARRARPPGRAIAAA